ncbi:hypothetical protein MTO96_044261 [Rhipicephalus appendiculatus]
MSVGTGKSPATPMAQFRFVRLFYFVQALARFATYPSWDVSRTVYLLPTDQQSNQPVHSDNGEVPYHLMTFNDCPQDAIAPPDPDSRVDKATSFTASYNQARSFASLQWARENHLRHHGSIPLRATFLLRARLWPVSPLIRAGTCHAPSICCLRINSQISRCTATAVKCRTI